jgi:hypothetical protein
VNVELATTSRSGERWGFFRNLGQKLNESAELRSDIKGSFKSTRGTGPREIDTIIELRARLFDREGGEKERKGDGEGEVDMEGGSET